MNERSKSCEAGGRIELPLVIRGTVASDNLPPGLPHFDLRIKIRRRARHHEVTSQQARAELREPLR